MAAELLTDASRALDANASPYAGATWSFYATGTTTPQSVYANAALSVPLGVTVTADAGGKFVPIYFDGALLYRGICKNAAGSVTLHDIDPINPGVFAQLASPTGASSVGNRLPAGADLRTQNLSEYIEGDLLKPSQFSGTAEQQLVRAITEAGTVRHSTLGQGVLIPRGVIQVSAPFNLNNRASVKGVNRRGAVIQAAPTHSGPSMVTVINGSTSTFDNRLEELTLDCNEVASLSGVISSAWQEGGGVRDVLIQKFRGYGVNIVDTIGGVSALKMSNSEFMGSPNGSLACIRVNDPSLVSSFILHMDGLSLVGAGVVAAPGGAPEQAAARAKMPACVDIVNGSTTSIGVHCEVAERGFRLDGNGRHIIIGAKGSTPNGVVNAGVETLVEIAATFTGTLIMIGCSRNGSINLVRDLRVGGLGTISYDTDVHITPDSPVGTGAIAASASIDGTGTPSVTKGFGIASITDNGTGDYTIVLTRSAPATTSYSVFASMNANGWVQCALNGNNSVRLRCFNGSGGAIDVNELKVLVVRVA